MRARLSAYAGLQLRDYFTGRAVLTVGATAIAAWAYAATHGLAWSAFDAAGGIEARAQLQRAFEFVLASFTFIAAMFAAHGLVAGHRSHGYDRVLFARPVSPVRYYVQGFLLAGIGAVVVGSAGAELYAVAVHPVSVLGVAAYVALGWLSIGGLAFLLSTFTVFHAPVLIALIGADLLVDRYASGLQSSGTASAALTAAQYLLPPGHVIAALSGPFTRGLIDEPHLLVWPIAFGGACILATVLLLRRRPFGS